MDNNFIFWLWDLEYTKLNRSSEVVFNEDSMSSAWKQAQKRKRVSFDYSPSELEVEMPKAKSESTSESSSRAERELIETTLSNVLIVWSELAAVHAPYDSLMGKSWSNTP